MRLLRRCGLAIPVAALLLGSAVPARGALLWTLTATPLSVTTGTETTFSLRASLTLIGDIRCVEVGVPGNFTIHRAAVVASNAGDSWISEIVGNGVRIRTTSGGDRLRSLGDYVDFTITATAWSTGSLAWASHAHDDEDCAGSESLLSLPPIVLVTGPPVTPTPAPTLAPTPAPTPGPTSRPTAQATLTPTPKPTPMPTVAPTSQPETSQPAAASLAPRGAPAVSASDDGRATTSPTPTPIPSGVAAPTPRAGDAVPPVSAAAGGTGGSGAGADGRLGVEVPIEDGGPAPAMPIALGTFGLLGSIDTWIVPSLLLGVPGLLAVAFVILQAIGALAWIPAIRRLRGAEAAR